ncbi:alpha/beta hydrolase [Methylicorpusculum sp.]|uniref:alpha/beta hydrolase n=1 Tax=Methylicorpusculum sp. TaxID=2713644 RepID=UPI002725D133|nr:alpha/beta fold hydrolase [Methylicorpusculum sp.]MDO8843858.1 alpha/beta fold hydrolase [Methylicorpusculum sp.]
MIKTSRLLLLLIMISLFTGCSRLLFYPYKTHVRTPKQLGLTYTDISVITRDGIKIHGWLLPAQGTLKGSIYFLHGNAENVSTHIMSVEWLPEQGYQVFMIDYRGFGLSEGEPALPDVFMDIEAGFDWLFAHSDNKPLFLLGQSLGASLGLFFAGTQPTVKNQLAGVISDSSFTRYNDIVRHAASTTWLTWPLQYPASWLMAYPYDPIDVIDRIAPTPLLIVHGTADTIIPFEHGQRLYEKAGEPKQFLKTDGGHIQTFMRPEHRLNVLAFLNRITTKHD